jgi:hypothetical protein
MAAVIYGLCALTALLCTVLLFMAHQRSRYALLFWSGLCFAILTINNVLLVIDKIVFPGPELDLSFVRGITSAAAMAVLLYGLIWRTE